MTFTRINTRLLLPMAFILPLWLTIGRALLGSDGWLTVIYFFTAAPILLISLLVLRMLIKQRKGRDGQTYLGTTDSILLNTLYVTVFLHGFFLVDGGDTNESVHSVATRIFGNSFQHVSETLGLFFLVLACIVLAVSFGVFIYERVRRPMR